MNEDSKNLSSVIFIVIFITILAIGLGISCNIISNNHQTVNYVGQITSIGPSVFGGFSAVINTDQTSFSLPVSLVQANLFKSGDIVNLTLEFDGWGNFIRILKLEKSSIKGE